MSSATLKFRALRAEQTEDVAGAARTAPTSFEQWLLACAGIWFMTGLFLDGWAHNHIPELETFFTPWHAVFYSGYALIALSLLYVTLRHRRIGGGSLRQAVPVGYGFAAAGAGLFLLGGVGDLIWPEVFGIEKSIEALLSPTHLVLATSAVMMTGANLHAWFASPPPIGLPRFVDQLPMLLSAASVLSILTFMLQFSHFIVLRAGTAFAANSAEMTQAIAITGYLLDTAMLLGCFFVIARRAKVAFGAFTFLFALNTLAMGLMRDGLALLPAALVTGVLADTLARHLFPFDQHAKEVRVFSFVVPFAFFLLYFVTIALHGGIAWSVHLFAGSVAMAGLAGLLLSYVALPPREGV